MEDNHILKKIEKNDKQRHRSTIYFPQFAIKMLDIIVVGLIIGFYLLISFDVNCELENMLSFLNLSPLI